MLLLNATIDAGITGFESPAADFSDLELSLNDLLIPDQNATFIAKASGCSMQNVGIYDGDILIIKRSETPTNGSIIVANYNGSYVCKRIDTINGILLSASVNHGNIKLLESDTFQIEGVVTSSIRIHKRVTDFL